jgi:hypothetical protein
MLCSASAISDSSVNLPLSVPLKNERLRRLGAGAGRLPIEDLVIVLEETGRLKVPRSLMFIRADSHSISLPPKRMICKIWYFICQTMSGKLGTQTQPKYAPLCGLDCLMSGPCWHQINDSIELSSLHKGDMNPYGLGLAITSILHRGLNKK